MSQEIKQVSLPTLRRLPRYIQLLKRLRREEVASISATIIANELGLEPIQVRKDLSVTGITGKPKTGFILEELNAALRDFLNWGNTQDAFLAGAGALGVALTGYPNFKDYGLNIISAFDNNPKKIGTKIHGIEIFPVDKIADLAARMKVNIGIITVPADAAQEMADIMVEGGIKAIWNFAPVQLKVPEEVILESVSLAQSLGVLTHKLAFLLERE